MQIEILFEDADLIAVNKPAGMLTIPDRFNAALPSLVRSIEAKIQSKAWIVHRLDRETSGIIVFAKNEHAHKYMSLLFQDRNVEKKYLGLVIGRVLPPEGRLETAIAEHPVVSGKMAVAKKGKPAITEYKVLTQWPLHALMEFRILTGRTHQIRVHMQYLGHPLVCDELYGDGKPFFLSAIKRKYRVSEKDETERPLLSRVALHASRLSFAKENGEMVDIEAPLPRDIAACVKQLDKWTQSGSNSMI